MAPVTDADGRRAAVVVGGDVDIGPACAFLLAQRGHRVLFAAADPADVCEEVTRRGGDAIPVPVDVNDPGASAQAVAAAASAWPAVHALVNCHFWLSHSAALDVTLEDWERSLRVNLTGPLMVTRALLPLLVAADGAGVVHLGSVDGTFGNPRVAAYSAAKAGLVPLTHLLAHDLAPHRIRVNCLARAAVATPGRSVDDSSMRAVVGATPLGRPADPREIASVAAFLVSEDAAYITGAVITVDGGRTGITRGTA